MGLGIRFPSHDVFGCRPWIVYIFRKFKILTVQLLNFIKCQIFKPLPISLFNFDFIVLIDIAVYIVTVPFICMKLLKCYLILTINKRPYYLYFKRSATFLLYISLLISVA